MNINASLKPCSQNNEVWDSYGSLMHNYISIIKYIVVILCEVINLSIPLLQAYQH